MDKYDLATPRGSTLRSTNTGAIVQSTRRCWRYYGDHEAHLGIETRLRNNG